VVVLSGAFQVIQLASQSLDLSILEGQFAIFAREFLLYLPLAQQTPALGRIDRGQSALQSDRYF
jgi:hypothetical protein